MIELNINFYFSRACFELQIKPVTLNVKQGRQIRLREVVKQKQENQKLVIAKQKAKQKE
jgi:hypothetical protein